MLGLRFFMQVSAENIIIIVVLITAMFLTVAGFLLAYVSIYNRRKRKHFEEKQYMQRAFLNELLESKLEIQEQTFNTVSEEIHDNVGQILSLASIQLSMAIQGKDSTEATLLEIKENVDNSLHDLRNIARNLNGGYLQQLSLLQFLEKSRIQISKNDFLICEVMISGEEKDICLQNKIILFRILQECFQNVIKHAKATTVTIKVLFGEAILNLIFKDNGKGFDTEKQRNEPPGGIGIQNMKNRIDLIKGSLNIQSTAETGTIICLNIPYEK